MFEILKNAFNSISPITENDWLMIEPYLTIRNFTKNEYYTKAGDFEDKVGFVTKGSFKWYFINPKGDEVNFHFYFENKFVVEFNSFLSGLPSQMYVQAMEDSQVIMLPKREIILQLYANSHSWERLGRVITESTYLENAQRVRDFLLNNPEQRYINLMQKHPNIFQRVSLTNISSYLGIQPQSLSRIRKRIIM